MQGKYLGSKPSNMCQLTKEQSTPSVTDTSHGLHMAESQNDSDTYRILGRNR